MAACSSLPSIGPRTATGLPTHIDGGSGQVLRFCEKMHDAGDLTTAAATCEKAHRLDPGAPAPLLELASILGEMNEPDLSIAAYRAVLETSPANADAHYGLGRTYLDQGQSDLALAEFQAALNGNPKDPRHFAAVGVAQGLLGAHAEAQRVFRDGLLVAPQDVSLRNNLGLSLVQSGRYDQGLKILEALAKDSSAGQASHDNLLLAQGLAATARAEIMLAEVRAKAEAEAQELAALEAETQKTQERMQTPAEDPGEAVSVAAAPAVLNFSFPNGAWPMDGPGESGAAPMENLAVAPAPSETRQTFLDRILARRGKPRPNPITAPTALTEPLSQPSPKPVAKTAQAVQAPRSLIKPQDRQMARADFDATSDAGPAMGTAPKTMPQPSVPSAAKSAQDTYTVQFASYTSEERAWRGWDSLQGAAHGLLKDIEPTVQRSDLGGEMGTVYRLRTKTSPRQTAKTLCSALQAQGVDCLVIKSRPEIAATNAVPGPAAL